MSEISLKKRVLWVDDDSPIVGMTVDGVEFHTAQNCKEALQLLTECVYGFDYLIIDIVLPQGGWKDELLLNPGIELVRHVKKTLGHDTPVAIYSIYLDEKRSKMAIRAGADVVASKQRMGLKGVLEKLDEVLR